MARIPLSIVPGSATNAPTLGTDLNLMFTELYTGAAASAYSPPATGGVATTVAADLNNQDWTPARFGAIGDGITDDTAAMTAAIAALNAGSFDTLILNRIYAINGTLTVTRNGTSIVGRSNNVGICGLRQLSTTANTLVFQNPTPTTTKTYFNSVVNLSIQGPNIPTAGVGLTCNGCGNFQALNITIYSHWSGINIIGGYVHQWNNVIVLPGPGFTTRNVGSYGINFTLGQDSQVCSEMSFTNLDLKGNNISGQNTLDFGMQFSCGDGVTITNGHVGFAATADLSVSCGANPAYVQNLEFANIYFDGGLATVGGVGVQFIGTGQQIARCKFSSCSFQDHASHGATLSASNCSQIRFNDCQFSTNGGSGMIWGAQTDWDVIACTFYNNNNANTAANGIGVTGASRFRIQQNLFFGNNYASTGFNLVNGILVDATSSFCTITGNQFTGCNTSMGISCATTTFGQNRPVNGGFVSVTAAAALPSTFIGFDFVQVSGNTNITSISGTNIDAYEVNFYFTGTPTFTRGSNILLTSGGGNVVATPGTIVKMVNDGSGYREISRAIQ